MPTRKTVTVKVPQDDGEITIRQGIKDPVTYTVSGGTTKVAEPDVSHFLAVVDGAALADPPKE